MAVCGIHPELYKLFALCQLPRLLHIYPTVDDALQGLWRAGAP
jgi:anti-anti-sigma regulatory factor